MIYFRRGVAYCVDVFQDKILTSIHPLADQACLNEVLGMA